MLYLWSAPATEIYDAFFHRNDRNTPFAESELRTLADRVTAYLDSEMRDRRIHAIVGCDTPRPAALASTMRAHCDATSSCYPFLFLSTNLGRLPGDQGDQLCVGPDWWKYVEKNASDLLRLTRALIRMHLCSSASDDYNVHVVTDWQTAWFMDQTIQHPRLRRAESPVQVWEPLPNLVTQCEIECRGIGVWLMPSGLQLAEQTTARDR